jgi:hypothetical protein
MSLLSKEVSVSESKYAVLEALDNDLTLSFLQVLSKREVERIKVQKQEGLGVDPRVGVVARYIVDQVNKNTNLLRTDQEKQLEYTRHLKKAAILLEKLEKRKQDWISEFTTFAIEENVERAVLIRREEIEQSTSYHISKVSRSFESFMQSCGSRTEDIHNIVLLGKAFSNERLVSEFNRFGKNKLRYIPETEEGRIIEGLLLKSESREKTVTLNSGTKTYQSSSSPVIEQLSTSALKQAWIVSEAAIGQSIRLITNNNDGKGEAIEELKYLGNNTFLVLLSTRGTIRTNDFAKTLTPAWFPSIPIEFEITRNGIRFPNANTIYSTRKVVRLEFV